LGGISCLAEFDGAVHRLFRKTPDIMAMPAEGANSYTITLWDLPTLSEVDVVVDERLPMRSDGGGLLGCVPSRDGELWVCYLEKALAIHCGGWDRIHGGQTTHAFALLTGCREQRTIKATGGGRYGCFGTWNPNDERWEQLANSPHDSFRGLWPMSWPEVGGGGEAGIELGLEETFGRMCEWDATNFMMAAGSSGSGSDSSTTDGIVDSHAYSVLTCVRHVAGTSFDLLKCRNPWGSGGELANNPWGDGGGAWDEYPEVRAELKPVAANDGLFWVSKEDFFEHFDTVYLSPTDMSAFLQDPPTEEELAAVAAEKAARAAAASEARERRRYEASIKMHGVSKLVSANFPERRVRHRNFELWQDESDAAHSETFEADSSFTLRAAEDGAIRFESVNFPNHYIRHQSFVCYLHEDDGSEIFTKDSSFCLVAPLNGDGQYTSLQSVNFPTHHLRHYYHRLKISEPDEAIEDFCFAVASAEEVARFEGGIDVE